MDADIKELYNRLHSKYPLELKSSLEMGFKTKIDYPVLCGTSILGSFELFRGDFLSFILKRTMESFWYTVIFSRYQKQKKLLLIL